MAFEGCLGVLVGLWGAILPGRGDLRTGQQEWESNGEKGRKLQRKWFLDTARFGSEGHFTKGEGIYK